MENDLDWEELVESASEQTCECYAEVVGAWLNEEVPRPDLSEWAPLIPVLQVWNNLSKDQEDPFGPVSFSQIPGSLLVSLTAKGAPCCPPDVRARLIHLAWHRRLCSHSLVQDGVEAYLESAKCLLNHDSWLTPFARFKGALDLGCSLRDSPAADTAVQGVEDAIRTLYPDDPLYFLLRLQQLLLDHRRGNPVEMLETCIDMAARARANYEAHGIGPNGLESDRELAYLETALAWAHRAKEEQRAVGLQRELGEAYARRAHGVIEANWPSRYSVAEHFLEKAIQSHRVAGASSRIEDLRGERERIQRQAVAEMGAFSFSVDLGDTPDSARGHVSSLPLEAALLRLVAQRSPPTSSRLDHEVRLHGARAHQLFPTVRLGPRGTKQVSRGSLLDATETEWAAERLREAHLQQQINAISFIEPALDQIAREHLLDSRVWLHVLVGSEFVSPPRRTSYARGLASGVRQEWDTSAAILVPQFEHGLRELFSRTGIVTTTLPGSGIQNELDLNKMLTHPRVGEVLSEEWALDLQALLTEKAGANLRNDLAHGILDDDAKIAAKIYLWWICLHFALCRDHTVAPLSCEDE